MSYKRTNPAEIRNSCLYFCLFAIALAETVTLSDFKATSSLAGKTCKREDMVFSSSNRNAVECSAICSQEPECTGIFHSYTKRSCIGCRVLYSTETSLEDGNEDTKYLYNCGQTNTWVNFEESHYKLFSSSMNYNDAKELCQMQCSFPVNLGSFSEVEFIKNLAKDANVLGVYIGLEYNPQTTEWIWGDDGSHPAVTDWSPAEPNGDGSELCVALLNIANIDYRWADVNCAALLSVVCEKK